MSKGYHPFDQSKSPLFTAIGNGTLKPHELETNICAGDPQYLWSGLTPEGKMLIECLLCSSSSQRPSANDLLKYKCYFWSKLKKITFMKTIADQIEVVRPGPPFTFGWHLECTPFGDHIRSYPWDIELAHLYNELCPRRPYKTTSVVGLIRFFRNAYAHYEERSQTCKGQLLNDIFFAKFPEFFLTVWTVVDGMGWMRDDSGRDWLLREINEEK
jgi:hypothetical protein